jgi:hypothetical protein
MSTLTRLALLFSLLASPPAEAGDEYGFRILRAELVPVADGLVLNADIDYRFSEPAIDALRNGVPLTLAVQFNVSRDRPFWWSETVLSERREFRIRYHSLAKLFQLVHVDSGALRNFASLQALLEDMGSIRAIPIADASRLQPGTVYRARLKAGLDIEALPLPLRPIAYVTPAWYLDSPWYRWSFAN